MKSGGAVAVLAAAFSAADAFRTAGTFSHRLYPQLSARSTPPVASAICTHEAGNGEDWQAAALLHDTFGGATLFYYGSLRVPSLNANVFFKPVADPVIAVATRGDSETEVCGVAQLILAELRPAIGVSNLGSRPVAYVQSVAVAEGARRQGVARSLMAWCTAAARERWASGEAPAEMWLAVSQENAPALSLYESMGFARRSVAFENVLMSASLDSIAAEPAKMGASDTDGIGSLKSPARPPARSSTIRASASDEPPATADAPQYVRSAYTLASGGIGWGALLGNLGVQTLYVGVAALGVSLLLQPFGGPNTFSLLGLSSPWAGDCAPWAGQQCAAASGGAVGGVGLSDVIALVARSLAECALGLGVAYAELGRLGVRVPGVPGLRPPMEQWAASPADSSEFDERSGWLDYGPAQAEQMRPLYEISAGENRLVLASGAILVWQLVIALAEELYYRGFVESAGVLAFSPLSSLGVGGACIREAIPLLVSAALFGLVHTEFVQDAPPSADGDAGAAADVLANASEQQIQETKAYWFRATALYGALYSLLYVISGHRLLAPIFCHAGLNVGQALRDWGRMRITPEAELQRIFAQRDARADDTQ